MRGFTPPPIMCRPVGALAARSGFRNGYDAYAEIKAPTGRYSIDGGVNPRLNDEYITNI